MKTRQFITVAARGHTRLYACVFFSNAAASMGGNRIRLHPSKLSLLHTYVALIIFQSHVVHKHT